MCSFVGTLLQVVILDGVGDNLMMRGGAMGKTVPRKNGQFFFPDCDLFAFMDCFN